MGEESDLKDPVSRAEVSVAGRFVRHGGESVPGTRGEVRRTVDGTLE